MPQCPRKPSPHRYELKLRTLSERPFGGHDPLQASSPPTATWGHDRPIAVLHSTAQSGRNAAEWLVWTACRASVSSGAPSTAHPSQSPQVAVNTISYGTILLCAPPCHPTWVLLIRWDGLREPTRGDLGRRHHLHLRQQRQCDRDRLSRLHLGLAEPPRERGAKRRGHHLLRLRSHGPEGVPSDGECDDLLSQPILQRRLELAHRDDHKHIFSPDGTLLATVVGARRPRPPPTCTPTTSAARTWRPMRMGKWCRPSTTTPMARSASRPAPSPSSAASSGRS